MTVRIVHKNSVAEDKRPTAGQLANGEIAVNLHEAGAFLSIKDTAGNVQQVGGVKVSTNSPANPVKGTFWLDSDNNTLFIYDGSQWRGVTGGGGGGGGSINLAEGDAINITQAGSTYTINVVAGAGITLAGDNVAVELDTDATTVGLKMVGAGDAGKLSAKVATASTLGSVKVDDTTIKVSNGGELRAIVPDPLTYKGNINPTTEDSGADAIPTGSVGDAYTCSWGGTKVNGSLDNSPDWLSAIKGSDTTATLGDLLIINSGDGSGANEWTLVKTGTVDSGASIDVGDGTTASFPPASPQEGDVWYNLDDARTYVYITDSSGDTVWVDISPQGNQTLWKKDTTDIEPQTSTDDLKIPNLAGGTSTAGTTVVMADTSGVLVSNAVGDGLEISSGKLQVKQDSSGTGVNLQTVTDAGNTTTFGITLNNVGFNQLDLQTQRTGDNNNIGGLRFLDKDGNPQSAVYGYIGGRLGLLTDGTERVYIDENGNVLIGGTLGSLPVAPNIKLVGSNGNATFEGEINTNNDDGIATDKCVSIKGSRIYTRNDSGSSATNVIAAFKGGDAASNIVAAIKGDGSAEFGSVAYLNTNGVRDNSQATLVSYATDGTTATGALYADGKLLLGNTTADPNISLFANGSVSLSDPKQGSAGYGTYIGPNNEAGNISQYSDDDSASSSGSRTTSFLSGWSGTGAKTLKYSIGHDGSSSFAGSLLCQNTTMQHLAVLFSPRLLHSVVC